MSGSTASASKALSDAVIDPDGITRGGGRRPRGNAHRGGTPLVWGIALVVVAATLGPVLYGLLGGFRTNGQLAENPAGLPDPWVLTNYTGVLTNPAFWQYTWNSTVIAVVTTLIVVVFGTMAAYPLARYSFKGREHLFFVFVMGLLFPATVAVIPLFILISKDLGLANTWWGSRCRRRPSPCRSRS
ncbi:hypothetical protein GCM10025865_17160 [Paraoerskovia sediminicola]|uniref:ABC transmembrane type-1 domain-containing protein n=1 Tax=Paraoerskovia sediminicola TaxID=1138587 RepID=A0ABM8G2S4_9CELL|nr:hypothetical protein GCM10025865_17160 [Paraoerskovia sediminicola]